MEWNTEVGRFGNLFQCFVWDLLLFRVEKDAYLWKYYAWYTERSPSLDFGETSFKFISIDHNLP